MHPLFSLDASNKEYSYIVAEHLVSLNWIQMARGDLAWLYTLSRQKQSQPHLSPSKIPSIHASSHEKTSLSDLPADITSAVADRLTDVGDHARFRSVCPSWRSATAAHAARRSVLLLLIPTQSYDTGVSRHVWSPADDSLGEIHIPAALGRPFLFASHCGWTLAVAGDLSSIW